MISNTEKLGRLKSYIEYLDPLIEGGFLENSIILITGPPGSLKSTFAYQSLYKSALNGEKSLYISLEQRQTNLIASMDRFNMGKGNKNFTLADLSYLRRINPSSKGVRPIPNWINILKSLIKHTNEEKSLKRVALDSLNCFFLLLGCKNQFERREILFDFFEFLRDQNLLSFIIEEIPSYDKYTPSVEEFMVDGIIALDFEKHHYFYSRILVIKKMRTTNHSTEIFPVKLNKKGILVVKDKNRISLEEYFKRSTP
jgi:KaiC/GvpD/RAD55 family RecA-like ATPase